MIPCGMFFLCLKMVRSALFTRYAQSARPGCIWFWVRRWRHGGEKRTDPKWFKETLEKNEIDPRINWKWCPKATNKWKNRPKRVPKGSQEGQEIKATSSRRPWTPLGADFPAIHSYFRDHFGTETDPKSKKTTDKSAICCSASRSENGAKMVPKTIRNGAQDVTKSIPEASYRFCSILGV